MGWRAIFGLIWQLKRAAVDLFLFAREIERLVVGEGEFTPVAVPPKAKDPVCDNPLLELRPVPDSNGEACAKTPPRGKGDRVGSTTKDLAVSGSWLGKNRPNAIRASSLRLPLASLPLCRGARIDSDLPGEVLLAHAPLAAEARQPFTYSVSEFERIEPKEFNHLVVVQEKTLASTAHAYKKARPLLAPRVLKTDYRSS